MIAQPKPRRTYGRLFAAQMQADIDRLIAKNRAESAMPAPTHTRADACENRNSSLRDPGHDLELVEDWEIERLENKFSRPTQVPSAMCSYKAKNRAPEHGTEKTAPAANQNPTNDPEVAILLERFGDIRGVILRSPIFEEPCAPTNKGGWGTDAAGIIWLAKEYGLARVLDAVKRTKQERGVRNKGAFFNHAVRRGLEGKR